MCDHIAYLSRAHFLLIMRKCRSLFHGVVCISLSAGYPLLFILGQNLKFQLPICSVSLLNYAFSLLEYTENQNLNWNYSDRIQTLERRLPIYLFELGMCMNMILGRFNDFALSLVMWFMYRHSLSILLQLSFSSCGLTQLITRGHISVCKQKKIQSLPQNQG